MNEERIKELNDFVKEHNLKQEALSSCIKAMENSLEDDILSLGGFSIDEIRLEFIGHTLIFEHFFYSKPFVKTKIGLYKSEKDEVYIRGFEPIGYYELDTYFNGESFDDWLIVKEEKNNQLNVVYELEELAKMLPEEYFNTDSKYYEYITYISHCATFYQSKQYRTCQVFMLEAFEFILRTRIEEDFKKYVKWSKKYIQRIASYLDECGLIEEDIEKPLVGMGILKRRIKQT